MQTTTIRHISRTLLSGALLLSLASCINDNYLDEVAYTDGKVAVELSIQARSLSNNIKSSSGEQYVAGTEWENYVDFANGDYRIYFFTYNPDNTSDETTNNNLIAEFKPLTIYSTDLNTYTTYTLSGELDEETVANLENFKVVVVANWGAGNYPTELTASTTTIDDICNAQTAVFNAFVDASGSALMPSSSLHIPFFGVHEYSNVEWTANRKTYLSDYSSNNDNGTIALLRSMAKVEVILENTDVTFTEININNYNAQGYCAPTGVYLRGDYDHDGDWTTDFVDGLHLVSDANDANTKSFSLYKAQDKIIDETTGEATQYETWVAYLPEYDNTSSSAVYSYISAKFDYQKSTEDPNAIYFANYTDGSTTAYDEEGNADDRYDIYRNYLYRFHVTLADLILQVHVDKWEYTYDNNFEFTSDYTIQN